MVNSPDVHSSALSADAARAASDASYLQAASDARLNRSLLTRDLFAGGSASFLPPLLQAHELQLLGGGLSALRAPPAHHDHYNAFLNMRGHHHAHLGDSSYLQQALGGACSNSLFNSLGPAPGYSAPPLIMPSQTFASLNSRIPSLVSNASRPQPNAQEIQDAISTLQAATAPTMLKSSPPPIPLAAEKSTPPGGIAPMVAYMDCDEDSLSDYQCLLRKQIELFEA
jgi:hypothetical protein